MVWPELFAANEGSHWLRPRRAHPSHPSLPHRHSPPPQPTATAHRHSPPNTPKNDSNNYQLNGRRENLAHFQRLSSCHAPHSWPMMPENPAGASVRSSSRLQWVSCCTSAICRRLSASVGIFQPVVAIQSRETAGFSGILGDSWRFCQVSFIAMDPSVDIFEDSWRFLEIFGDFWRFLEILGDFWRFLEILGDSWRFLEILGDSWRFF